MNLNGYTAWLEIDLGAIKNNVRQIIKLSQKQVMAVIKANGYGHGAEAVARAAVEAGATWCGVARIEEALALRKAGLDCNLLVMGYTAPDCVPQAAQEHISLTIFDPTIARAYASKASSCAEPLHLQVKVDTGMSRQGLFPEDTPEFIHWLRQQPGVQVEGLYTHFARADEPQADTTSQQLQRFIPLVETLRAAGELPPLVHAANSAATLNYPAAHFDLVRPGIAIYGLHPAPPTTLLNDDFLPALTWKTLLTAIKTIPAGAGVSYGHKYYTSRPERIGVIGIGYADGFRRIDGEEVLIHGQRAPVVGRVCMDQCMIQLDHIPDAQIGDEVVLLGSQGNSRITAEEIGARWNTVNYEVVCGLASRLPRMYIG